METKPKIGDLYRYTDNTKGIAVVLKDCKDGYFIIEWITVTCDLWYNMPWAKKFSLRSHHWTKLS